jgi:outer membrane autotransporter protein
MPLILRGRVAWAHDWVDNPALAAAFQTLPGASFIVNGAPIPHDTALMTAGAELRITPSLSVIAKFDGELANGYQAFGGSGGLRYTW